MKYIRTEKGIYEVVGADSCSYLNAPPEMYYITSDNKNILKSKVIAQADTIEELCDCVVIKRTNTKTNVTFYVEYPMEHYQDVKLAMIDNHLDYIKIDYVKFGIWTDKGLIYVAKMNEKGELELL
jgi:hypothetical protein